MKIIENIIKENRINKIKDINNRGEINNEDINKKEEDTVNNNNKNEGITKI
jgi:hypothetical protein